MLSSTHAQVLQWLTLDQFARSGGPVTFPSAIGGLELHNFYLQLFEYRNPGARRTSLRPRSTAHCENHGIVDNIDPRIVFEKLERDARFFFSQANPLVLHPELDA